MDVHLQVARMIVEIDGHQYNSTIGSDVGRDGMYLEISDENDHLLGEIFYSDATGAMTFTAFRSELPLAVVEWMFAQARVRLPPTDPS